MGGFTNHWTNREPLVLCYISQQPSCWTGNLRHCWVIFNNISRFPEGATLSGWNRVCMCVCSVMGWWPVHSHPVMGQTSTRATFLHSHSQQQDTKGNFSSFFDTTSLIRKVSRRSLNNTAPGVRSALRLLQTWLKCGECWLFWCLSPGLSRTCPNRQSYLMVQCWTLQSMIRCAPRPWTRLREIPCTPRCGAWLTAPEEETATSKSPKKAFERWVIMVSDISAECCLTTAVSTWIAHYSMQINSYLVTMG